MVLFVNEYSKLKRRIRPFMFGVRDFWVCAVGFDEKKSMRILRIESYIISRCNSILLLL